MYHDVTPQGVHGTNGAIQMKCSSVTVKSGFSQSNYTDIEYSMKSLTRCLGSFFTDQMIAKMAATS